MSVRLASDDDLMCAAARGDEDAFAELVRRHRGWVRRLMVAFVRDDEHAEDLTQEAFCRVYRRAEDYEPRGNFVAWLKRIAGNLARDFLRQQRRTNLVPLCEIEETLSSEPHGDPLTALTSAALTGEVRSAIQALPDDQRLAVVMHYFGSMTLHEIAWAMKCPVGTIKSRLFYGLRRVRRSLAAEWDEEEGSLTP